jgi:hypothetical protein
MFFLFFDTNKGRPFTARGERNKYNPIPTRSGEENTNVFTLELAATFEKIITDLKK